MIVIQGTPLKNQFVKALADTKSEASGFQWKVELACGSWRKVAYESFSVFGDLGKMKRLQLDPLNKDTLQEQQSTVKTIWDLAVSSAAATSWAWATETYAAPNAFVRIFSADWTEASEGIAYMQITFEACLMAQQYAEEKRAGFAKVSECLDDVWLHTEQVVLHCWRAGLACQWDLADPCLRDLVFAANGGIQETKRQLEDHYRGLRWAERNQRNGRVMSTTNLLHTSIMQPTMQIPERSYVSAERQELPAAARQLLVAKLVGRKKVPLPDKLQQACLAAIHEKRVMPSGSDAARRQVAAISALVESYRNDWKSLQRCWLGRLVHAKATVYHRTEKRAFLSLGSYVWGVCLWELDFLGFTPTNWYWKPKPPNADNPVFRQVASEEHWCGIVLEPIPTATLPSELQVTAMVLGGKKCDSPPLISYCLSVIQLNKVTADMWKTLCQHLGGNATFALIHAFVFFNRNGEIGSWQRVPGAPAAPGAPGKGGLSQLLISKVGSTLPFPSAPGAPGAFEPCLSLRTI